MQKSIIERALELAATGEYARIDHIERKLNAEGYTNVASHLDGPTIRRQLRQVASEARGEPTKRRGRPPASGVLASDASGSDPTDGPLI
ncbi:hypothetical protein HNP52_002944 [Sphingomonas kyeonggiensis]|uniref:Uncharacterized protein n=1 Tax=Sphingomonas kyeonggiensis TaxID=1268553 RepID=A0A7W7NTD0_9SPHN|nr:hypothetical protein [Sphingomonas kyeonggiensis]MBB4839852.1 hypothetical protein [Sphingomonas kyeonggiensis]